MQEIVLKAVSDGRWLQLTRDQSIDRAARMIGVTPRRIRTILSMPLDGHLEAAELSAALEWERKLAEAELRHAEERDERNRKIITRTEWGGFS